MKRVRQLLPSPPGRFRFQAVALVAATMLASDLCGTSRASAEEPHPEIAILPVVHRNEDIEPLLDLAERVRVELAKRDVPHLDTEQTRSLINERHSRDPEPFSDQESEQLLSWAQQGSEAAVRGDWPESLAALRRVLRASEKAVESVNRRPVSAKTLWEACLLTTYVLQRSGDASGARAQARACRLLSPTAELDPEKKLHPKLVYDLLGEADAAIAAERQRPLRIRSKPEGAVARVNGQLLVQSRTPAALEHPAAETYRVQVECTPGRAGRVHLVRAGAESLDIDCGLERALNTESGGLFLDYRDADETDAEVRMRRDHLPTLRGLFQAPQALLLIRTPDGRVGLQRVGHGDGQAFFLRNPDAAQLATTLTRMLAPVMASSTNAAVMPTPAVTSRSRVLERWHLGLGFSSVALGAAGIAVGAFQFDKEHAEGKQLRETPRASFAYDPQADAWQDSRRVPFALVATGAALVTAGSLGMLLRAAPERPAASWARHLLLWVPAAVGAGLVTWGALDFARGTACKGDRATWTDCVDGGVQRDRGRLLLLASVPPLTVFASSAVVALRRVTITPRVDRQHAMVLAGMRW